MTTDLTAWRATRETVLELACGLALRVRKVHLFDLAASGQVPVPLIGQVEAVLTPPGMSLDVATLPENMAVIDLVVKAAAVDPPVADVADATHLGLHEIPATDRVTIFTWAQAEAAQLATFPGAQLAGAAPAGDQLPGPVAEPDPGAERPVDGLPGGSDRAHARVARGRARPAA